MHEAVSEPPPPSAVALETGTAPSVPTAPLRAISARTAERLTRMMEVTVDSGTSRAAVHGFNYTFGQQPRLRQRPQQQEQQPDASQAAPGQDP